MFPLFRLLNGKQSKIFYHLRVWCLKKAAGCNPTILFVTGVAGPGKSYPFKTNNYEATRVLQKICSKQELTTILLTAFTGTSSFNTGGCTIHHTFSLNKYMPIPYEPLREMKNASKIRSSLCKQPEFATYRNFKSGIKKTDFAYAETMYLHVFATNNEVNEHFLKITKGTCTDLQELLAKDFESIKTSGNMSLREKLFVHHKSDGMSSLLLLSVNARVMLIRNIDNGIIGTITEFLKE